MSEVDTLSGVRALARAREADQRLWSSNHGGRRHRHDRDVAVLEAVDAGLPLEQIADELGVLIVDVERMAATARRPRTS